MKSPNILKVLFVVWGIFAILVITLIFIFTKYALFIAALFLELSIILRFLYLNNNSNR